MAVIDDEDWIVFDDEEATHHPRIVVKLEIHYDPGEFDHPSQWDWEELIGSETYLLDYEDLDEGDYL